jgi:hypothetical protein
MGSRNDEEKNDMAVNLKQEKRTKIGIERA